MSKTQQASLQTWSPVNGEVYFERAYSSETEIEQCIKDARSAQMQWQQCGISERRSYCEAFLQALLANHQEIAQELAWQMGRPISQAMGELNGVVERSQYMMSIAESAMADIHVGAPGESKGRFMRPYPVGVVFVIAPWNYPYLTAINTIIPALLAGNTVLLKHSSQTPLCAMQLAKAFESAHLPQGVFQILFADHESTAKLLASPEIDYAAFTGSVAGGRKMAQAVSQRFIHLGLELGGKDPAYVCEDANIDHAVSQLVDGSFYNSGQSCCGIERIYVARSVFADFVDAFQSLTGQYRLGNPLHEQTNLGPVVSVRAANYVRGQVEAACAAGAQMLIAADSFAADDGRSAYLAPQVLIDVDHSMDLMREENFGPVVGIMPVDDDEQAVTLMNDSPYGLTASIWTADRDRALVLGARVNTGTWFMNRCDYLDPALAWTGVKDSGRGISLSVLGFSALTRIKSFNLR